MATLIEVQRAFKAAIGGPERAWQPEELHLRDQPPVPFVERVGIYHYAYASRLGKSLQEDYSGVRSWWGEAVFTDRVRPFLASKPIRDAIIAEVSAGFPDYLRENPAAEDPPFLPELARFEWECVQSAAMEDRTPAEVRSLAELGQADPTQIQLSVAPSLRLFTSPWPVDRLLEKTARPKAAETFLAISQCAEGAHWLRLGRRQFAILQRIAGGASLAKVLAAMGRAQVSPPQIQTWFQTWSARGIIRGFISKPS